jgi:hypothetical protein
MFFGVFVKRPSLQSTPPTTSISSIVLEIMVSALEENLRQQVFTRRTRMKVRISWMLDEYFTSFEEDL